MDPNSEVFYPEGLSWGLGGDLLKLMSMVLGREEGWREKKKSP